MKKNFIYGFAFLLITAVTIILLTTNFSLYGKYELKFYEETINNTTYNVGENYKYYTLELKKDNTFSVTYLTKDANAKEQINTGTFTVNGDTVTLKYNTSNVEQIIFETEIFTYSKGELNRNQTGYYESLGIETTIKQKFKK